MELATRTEGRREARVSVRARRWSATREPLPLETLWDRHGGSLYALACALLGDQAAAVRAVTLAMSDLPRTTASDRPEDALRHLAARVYWRSREVAARPSGSTHLPPVMAWLAQLAHLQRACLALCVFGGHTHREAADLLGATPESVAGLLTAGLRELGQLATTRRDQR